MDRINTNNGSIINTVKEEWKENRGILGSKTLENPSSFTKGDHHKIRSLNYENTKNITKRGIQMNEKSVYSFNIEGCLERAKSKPESLTTEEVYELIWHFKYSDNTYKNTVIDIFTNHFKKDPSRLNQTDAANNNAFHWAAKLKSFKTWKSFRDLLSNENNLLSQKNHFSETPWNLVLKSSNLEFVENVLLDELSRNPDSSIINDLIKQYGEAIKKYTAYNNKEEFVSKYRVHRALLAGDKTVIKNIITASYQTWKIHKETIATSMHAFLKSRRVTNAFLSYKVSKPCKLLKAGYKHDILKQALSQKSYRGENNKIISDFITYMRKHYSDWKGETKSELKYSLGIGYFMRTSTYLSIFETVIKGRDNEAISYINKLNSNHSSLKDLQRNPYTDQSGIASCIAAIFNQKDCYFVFNELGFTKQEILELAKWYAFEIAQSGALANVLSMLINVYNYNINQIHEFLSIRNQSQSTPFHQAVCNGEWAPLIKILKDRHFSLKKIENLLCLRDEDGDTPMHLGSQHLSSLVIALKIAGFSLKQIVELVSVNNARKTTPLDSVSLYVPTFIIALKDGGFSLDDITTFLSRLNESGDTLLDIAVLKGYFSSIIKALQRVGFSLKQMIAFLYTPNKSAQTLLHMAATRGHLASVIKALQEIGVSVKQINLFLSLRNKYADTPIHIAAMKGSLDSVLKVLKKIDLSMEYMEILLSTPNKSGDTPMHMAATEGKLHLAIGVLKEYGFSFEEITKFLSIKNEQDKAPLHMVAMNGCLSVVIKTLKAVGFSLKQMRPFLSAFHYFGEPLLHITTISNHLPDVIEVLDEIGFSKEDIRGLLCAKNNSGDTLLHIAAKKGFLPSVINALKLIHFSKIEIGRLLYLLDTFNQTPVHIAAYGGFLDSVIKVLKNNGFSKDEITVLLSQKNQNDVTAIYIASHHVGFVSVIQILKTIGFSMKEMNQFMHRNIDYSQMHSTG